MTTPLVEYARVKCDVVGDNTVGKTCLLIAFTHNIFPTDYIPRTFENHADFHIIDDTRVLLGLWDSTPGGVDDRLSPLDYPRTDVFVLCFSLVDPDSYERVRTKWAPGLAHYKPGVPVLLVGTKLDLRDDSRTIDRLHGQCVVIIQEDGSDIYLALESNLAPIQHHQGMAICKDIGAKQYLECSAITSAGVKTVFEHAMRLGLLAQRPEKRKSKHRGCVIL